MGRKKKGDELLDLPDGDEAAAEAEEEPVAKVGRVAARRGRTNDDCNL
jgi:hypothetical protein